MRYIAMIREYYIDYISNKINFVEEPASTDKDTFDECVKVVNDFNCHLWKFHPEKAGIQHYFVKEIK